MAYSVRFAPKAEADIRQFSDYLSAYNEALADRHMGELKIAIERHILPRPQTWQFFFLTGAPFRSYLFRLSRRTTYWIIFEIDDNAETVNILRFWNSARDPVSFEV